MKQVSAPQGYAITDILYQNDDLILCRGVRAVDGVPVILRRSGGESSPPGEMARLRHDFDMARRLEGHAVLKPLALVTWGSRLALIAEDFGGEPLCCRLGQPMAPGSFFGIATAITAAVSDLHRQGVVHKDLTPWTILLHPTTGEVRLIGLGLALEMPKVPWSTAHPGTIEGTLAYMAPEQTGRMNRAIDQRSDLYALGVIFYQMLTGTLPFHGRDAVEWVHCHLAREPLAPKALVPTLPEMLSRLVVRLLAKQVEDRYQSGRGLAVDLERCHDRWQRASDDCFTLGARDISERLQLPQRPYGRESEMARLRDAFDRVAGTGRPELVLVTGPSGIGKSTLVNELRPSVVEARGVFLAGKFEARRQTVPPYATLAQGFQALIQDILSGDEEQISVWRGRLLEALGSQGQLLVDVIPRLEHIIGRPPPLPELPAAEAQHRLAAVFLRFVGVFARAGQPLVLFFDDLHWADAGNLTLLQDLLVADSGYRPLLLIGACRDAEVGPDHPLTAMGATARALGATISEIALGPLTESEVTAFVADTVRRRREVVAPLAGLLRSRTGGNPFFMIQLLAELNRERLIRFDAGSGGWGWNLAQIQAEGFTSDVADLLAVRIRRLPPATRGVLTRAACLGHASDLATLAAVFGQGSDETAAHLAPAVDAGLLVCTGDQVRFVHDRVEEAAYALIPENGRADLHLTLARLLLARLDATRETGLLVLVADQFNRCPELITDGGERRRVAELNLAAGRKAKAAAGYDTAATYLAAGLRLVMPDGWSDCYRLTWDLHRERAQCDYLRGALDAALARLDTLLAQSRSILEQADSYRLRMALFTTRGDMERAIEDGLASLRSFDIELPDCPSREQVDEAFAAVWRRLGDRPIEALIDLPPMVPADMRMVMNLLADLGTPAIFGRRTLLPMTLARMVDITLCHGTTEASVWAYLWFGATLVQRSFGRIRDGYRFGKLAWDLMAREPGHGLGAKVNLVFGDLIQFYVHHVRAGREYITTAFRMATEAGDLPWACYSRNHLITNMLSCGDPLDQVWEESERGLAFVRQAGDPNIIDIISSQQRFILNMRGLTTTLSRFDGPSFDQDRFEAHIESSQMPLMICWYYILKLQARFITGDLEEAVAAAERAGALILASGPDIQGIDYDFFAALAKAGRGRPGRPPAAVLAEIEGHLALLRGWAENCPANFETRVALVAAEQARITGRELEAERLYEQAIRTARDNGFVHYEAIASELAACFHRERGFDLIADAYLGQAHAGYRRWGAEGKCRQLEVRAPRLGTSSSGYPPSVRLAAPADRLDLLSVVKASQCISAELVPARLQETLLRLAVEQAGARRGVLMLAEDGDLVIRAMAETEAGNIRVTIERRTIDPSAPAEAALLPLSVLNYVRRTGEAVVVASAETDGPTATDPYVALRRPRSILCLPILRKGALMGALYLENALLAGAFNGATLAALELLAAQAAITLETATAYAERERAEAALRDQIEFIRRLLETIPAPVYYKDEHGLYGGCNRAFEHYVGRTRAELIGKTVEAAWPKDLAETYRRADLALFRNPGTQVYETSFVGGDGQRRQVVLHKASLTRGDGSISGLIGVIWDISERTEAARALARAKEAAEAASAAKSRFLAAVGHDLRQPFQAIQLYHHLLMRRLTEPQLRDIGASLGEAVAAASGLLDTLLEVSTFDGGAIRCEITDFPLGPLLERVTVLFAGQAATKGLELRRVPTRVQVRSDPELLERVLRNLLTNAIGYTHRGRLLLGCRRCGDEVRIEVWDTGIGIPGEKLDAVFEDFFQLGNPERQRSKGFGLGLAIVRRTATLLNHRLLVRSWPDRGSVFAIVVPRADRPA
jgi:PAS domain S-box-containing protein